MTVEQRRYQTAGDRASPKLRRNFGLVRDAVLPSLHYLSPSASVRLSTIEASSWPSPGDPTKLSAWDPAI